MTNHLLDFSEQGAWLSAKNSQLHIERNQRDTIQVPFSDIAAIIIAHPQVTFTQAVIEQLMTHKGILVTCDRKHLPVGMILPLQFHGRQSSRLATQASTKQPLKKGLWKQIIQAKLKAQATVLASIVGHDGGLNSMAKRVKSGDPENLEAQGAKKYWNLLFGSGFRRRHEEPGVNSLLNYGYAILRAIVARAICSVGLHPGLGLHHHNQYSSFCLADDLMEPLRPVIDRIVHSLTCGGDNLKLTTKSKSEILSAVTERREVDSEQLTLFEITARITRKLVRVFENGRGSLEIPLV